MNSTCRWLVLLLGMLSLSALGARTLYVDNVQGNDDYNGLQAQVIAAEKVGPLRSIQQAFRKAEQSDRIEILNTGVPYRGGNVLSRVGGTAERPMVIEGNGATISGLAIIGEDQWEPVDDRIVKTSFWPMSNRLKGDRNFPYWVGTPQIWWLDGAPGINCLSEEELRRTPSGFFWNKSERAVWFHLPAGKKITEVEVMLPVHGTGLNIRGNADYVVVQNLRSMYSWNDGFSAHGSAKSLTFRRCIAVDNCGQGFSMHGTVRALVEDSYAARNASSGACDVNHCQVTYRRCVLEANSFEAGVYTTEETQTYYEDCLIFANAPFEQVWQVGHSRMVFFNSIIAGSVNSDRPLVRLGDGNVTFIQSTLLNGSTLVDLRVSGSGTLVLDHCVVGGFSAPLLGGADGRLQVKNLNSVFEQGVQLSGPDTNPAEVATSTTTTPRALENARVMAIQFEGDPALRLPEEPDLSAAGQRYRRPAPIGARLPEVVWKTAQMSKTHAAAARTALAAQ